MGKGPQKRRSRALQILHAWELQGRPDLDRTVSGLLRHLPRCRTSIEEAEGLVQDVTDQVGALDATIAQSVDHWRLERLGLIERNILRLALVELAHGDVPPKVVINEAVNLAHRFAGAGAPGFINGVLDAAARHSGRL